MVAGKDGRQGVNVGLLPKTIRAIRCENARSHQPKLTKQAATNVSISGVSQ